MLAAWVFWRSHIRKGQGVITVFQSIFTYESIFADTVVHLVTIPLPPEARYTLIEVNFPPGMQQLENLVLAPVPGLPDYSVVQFVLRVPFEARLTATGTGEELALDGYLPDTQIYTVVYTPLAGQGRVPHVTVESGSRLLVTSGNNRGQTGVCCGPACGGQAFRKASA